MLETVLLPAVQWRSWWRRRRILERGELLRSRRRPDPSMRGSGEESTDFSMYNTTCVGDERLLQTPLRASAGQRRRPAPLCPDGCQSRRSLAKRVVLRGGACGRVVEHRRGDGLCRRAKFEVRLRRIRKYNSDLSSAAEGPIDVRRGLADRAPGSGVDGSGADGRRSMCGEQQMVTRGRRNGICRSQIVRIDRSLSAFVARPVKMDNVLNCNGYKA